VVVVPADVTSKASASCRSAVVAILLELVVVATLETELDAEEAYDTVEMALAGVEDAVCTSFELNTTVSREAETVSSKNRRTRWNSLVLPPRFGTIGAPSPPSSL
jgi:hypothetical protein